MDIQVPTPDEEERLYQQRVAQEFNRKCFHANAVGFSFAELGRILNRTGCRIAERSRRADRQYSLNIPDAVIQHAIDRDALQFHDAVRRKKAMPMTLAALDRLTITKPRDWLFP